MLDWLLILVEYIFDFFFNIVIGLAVSEFQQMYEILGWLLSNPIACVVRCMGHLKKDRLAECWLAISRSEDCAKHVPVQAELPVSGAIGCLQKQPL